MSSLLAPEDVKTKFVGSNHRPLSDDELCSAVKALSNDDVISLFPKVERNLADPVIDLQKIGLFSFIPAKGATPNENGIYGFAKMRGNYATENESVVAAEKLIRDVDSVNTIFHAYVGRPFPLTTSEKFAKNTSNVDIKKQTIEAVGNVIKSKKEEDKKRAEEMKAREEELLADTSSMKDPALVEEDDYVTLRVKKAQLSWTYLEHINKIIEIKSLILKTRADIVVADNVNPELQNKFFDKYKEARKKAGLSTDDYNSKQGFTRYLVEDVHLPGIDDDVELTTTIMENSTIDLKKAI